jgi:hypothetical protein
VGLELPLRDHVQVPNDSNAIPAKMKPAGFQHIAALCPLCKQLPGLDNKNVVWENRNYPDQPKLGCFWLSNSSLNYTTTQTAFSTLTKVRLAIDTRRHNHGLLDTYVLQR